MMALSDHFLSISFKFRVKSSTTTKHNYAMTTVQYIWCRTELFRTCKNRIFADYGTFEDIAFVLRSVPLCIMDFDYNMQTT